MIIRTLTQLFKKPYNCEQYYFNYRKMSRVHVLNVAEKNDAAKNIAQLLSRGRSQRVSISPRNSLYDHDMYYASNLHSHSFQITSHFVLCRKKAYQNSIKFMNGTWMLKAMHVI